MSEWPTKVTTHCLISPWIFRHLGANIDHGPIGHGVWLQIVQAHSLEPLGQFKGDQPADWLRTKRIYNFIYLQIIYDHKTHIYTHIKIHGLRVKYEWCNITVQPNHNTSCSRSPHHCVAESRSRAPAQPARSLQEISVAVPHRCGLLVNWRSSPKIQQANIFNDILIFNVWIFTKLKTSPSLWSLEKFTKW